MSLSPFLAATVVVSGRPLLHSLGYLVIAGVLFWGAWALIGLITQPLFKRIAQIVWVVLVVIFAVDFVCGFFGASFIRW